MVFIYGKSDVKYVKVLASMSNVCIIMINWNVSTQLAWPHEALGRKFNCCFALVNLTVSCRTWNSYEVLIVWSRGSAWLSNSIHLCELQICCVAKKELWVVYDFFSIFQELKNLQSTSLSILYWLLVFVAMFSTIASSCLWVVHPFMMFNTKQCYL